MCGRLQILSVAPGLNGQLQVLPFRSTAFNQRINTMQYVDDAHHVVNDLQIFTATQLQLLARDGEAPPAGFLPPKAWAVIAEYYQS